MSNTAFIFTYGGCYKEANYELGSSIGVYFNDGNIISEEICSSHIISNFYAQLYSVLVAL